MKNRSFTLHFASDDGKNDYELDGRFTAIVNPCQSELDRVNIANTTIENIVGALKQLNNQPEGHQSEAQIEKLEAELFAENAELKAARLAFEGCVNRSQQLGGTGTGSDFQGPSGWTVRPHDVPHSPRDEVQAGPGERGQGPCRGKPRCSVPCSTRSTPGDRRVATTPRCRIPSGTSGFRRSSWKVLRKIRCSPSRAPVPVKAMQTLILAGRSNWQRLSQ